MVQLQSAIKDIEAAGTQVVAVSYDAVDTLKKYTEKESLSYLLLSDEGSKTIDAYGIRNTEVKAGTMTDGIPYPGTFLVGRDGTVKAKLFVDGYVQRHANEALIEAAKQLN